MGVTALLGRGGLDAEHKSYAIENNGLRSVGTCRAPSATLSRCFLSFLSVDRTASLITLT